MAALRVLGQTNRSLDRENAAFQAHQGGGIIGNRPAQRFEQPEVAAPGIEGSGQIQGNVGQYFHFIHVVQSTALLSKGQQRDAVKKTTSSITLGNIVHYLLASVLL